MELFSKLGWFFKSEKKSYALGIVMLLFIAILTGLVPMVIGWVIDSMANGTLTRSDTFKWALLLFAIAIAQYIMRYVWRMAIFGTSAKLEGILRARLFRHFTLMDQQFFQKYRTGDLMARSTNDLNMIRLVAGSGILTLVDSLTQGLITLGLMIFAVHWKLTLVSILPLPLLALLIRYVGSKLHFHSRQAQAAFSSMNDKVQESVTGMKVIKTFGEEKFDILDFEKMTQNVVDKNQEVYYYDAAFRPSSQVIMGLATMIGVFYGGFLVTQGEVSIGMLVAFISYISRLNWPMIAIGRLFNILERGSASYDRIQDILAERSSIEEAENPVEASIQGPLAFEMEEFTFPGAHQPTLVGVDFHIKEGDTLGIVGKTGSGKTAIFKLLLREYDCYRGRIEYNHINIKDYSLDALLTEIGYVSQDNFLFSTTIRENIRFGKPEATQEEIEHVARIAHVHDDIINFPEGYDTRVGERGVALSGGQKQRIAIARALLIDPVVLILDDSLSAVDATTEEGILSAIKESRDGRTTLIAAHRLSSVMHANEIIVLDEGHVIERGDHYHLIENAGWYSEMYHKQQLELEEKEAIQDGE